MNVLVLYQTRSGNTRKVSMAISESLREKNHRVTTKSIIEVQAADIENADAIFIGTWVQGFILFGVKPAGADLWVPALPSLEGKPVGIFCTYAFNPRGSLKTLAAMLEARGAQVIAEHAFRRNRTDEGIEPFIEAVFA